ncbi:MAG: OadG family protein [Eubacteriales bacterium]
MKKYLTLLCMITCTLLFTACGSKQEALSVDTSVLDTFTSSIVGVITDPVSAETYLSLGEYEMAIEEMTWQQAGLLMSSEVFIAGIESYQDALEEIGDSPVITAINNEVGNDSIVATVSVDGRLRDAEIVILYDEKYEITSVVTNVDYTFGEQMTKAGLNTLLGLGSVFSVLILIMFIISRFKYIAIFEEKSKQSSTVSERAVEQVVERIVEQEEIAVDQDCELVAVIAAAIAASEGATTTDGFVVRSIRKHK